MSELLRHRVALFDVIAIPLLVEWYIWRLQFTARNTWIIFPIWLIASFWVNRDTPTTLGWRADNLWPATKQASLAFALMAAGLVVVGWVLGAPRLSPNLLSVPRLWRYLAFCVLQQVALNSFLNNRIILLISNRWLSSVVTGGIFAACHWPNPLLVPLTFVAGSVMAWLFARHRNILPLVVGQAVLGSLVSWSFPLAWHHHLRVGPGYYWE